MSFFKNNVVLDLPSITEINFIKIDRNYLKVIFINFFLFFIPLLTLLLVLHFFVFPDVIKKYGYLYFTIFFIIFSLLFMYYIFSFPLRMFALRDKDVSYKSGLFFKVLTTVPFSRIQHVEIDEGPFSRMYNLASLSVFTAGDSSDDLVIRGIKKDKALQIKEFISNKING